MGRWSAADLLQYQFWLVWLDMIDRCPIFVQSSSSSFASPFTNVFYELFTTQILSINPKDFQNIPLACQVRSNYMLMLTACGHNHVSQHVTRDTCTHTLLTNQTPPPKKNSFVHAKNEEPTELEGIIEAKTAQFFTAAIQKSTSLWLYRSIRAIIGTALGTDDSIRIFRTLFPQEQEYFRRAHKADLSSLRKISELFHPKVLILQI